MGRKMSTAIARDADDPAALVRRYAVQGPRYTSYPTALNFSEAFTEQHYLRFLAEAHNSPSPLSLYVHIPFCSSLCYYCACNKVISKDPQASRRYLNYLQRELQMLSQRVGLSRRVTQLHFGGGTPNYLDKAEMTELVHQLASHFNLDDSAEREFSIELDPRCVDADYLALLKGLGFNRVSFGVQDTNAEVQRAINRLQSVEMITELIALARQFNFRSISVDLIYGLPLQTVSSFSETLDSLIAMAPDRIALYHYAHMPARFKWQKSMDRYVMPDSEEKLRIFALAGRRLRAAGYCHIGMDHFVKPDDELARYQRQGRLQRNFQGYSTCHSADVLAMGVSAISSLNSCYVQNHKSLEDYYRALDQGHLPVARGLELTAEDQLRRYIIMQLACNLRLNFSELRSRYQVNFQSKFADLLVPLQTFARDGVVTLDEEALRVTDSGRLLLRNICMLFDDSLPSHQGAYSNTL